MIEHEWLFTIDGGRVSEALGKRTALGLTVTLERHEIRTRDAAVATDTVRGALPGIEQFVQVGTAHFESVGGLLGGVSSVEESNSVRSKPEDKKSVRASSRWRGRPSSRPAENCGELRQGLKFNRGNGVRTHFDHAWHFTCPFQTPDTHGAAVTHDTTGGRQRRHPRAAADSMHNHGTGLPGRSQSSKAVERSWLRICLAGPCVYRATRDCAIA